MDSKNEFPIRYSKRAEKEYYKLLDYIIEYFGNKKAEQVDKKISKTLNQISINPIQFPESKERRGTRRCVLSKQTTLYYRVKQNHVEVITFWTNRKNPHKKSI